MGVLPLPMLSSGQVLLHLVDKVLFMVFKVSFLF